MTWTRNQFLTTVGAVAADITQPRGTVRYETAFAQVALRIAGLGRLSGGKVLHTIAEHPERPWEPIHVVTVKGFRKEGEQR